MNQIKPLFKFTTRGNWTKDSMIEHMRKEFRGKAFYWSNPRGEFTKGSCMYRTPDGKKCAVGMFIPDDRYDPAMDSKENMDSKNTKLRVGPQYKNGTAADTIFEFWPEVAALFPLEERALLELQKVHDGNFGAPDVRTDAKVLRDLIEWVEWNVV